MSDWYTGRSGPSIIECEMIYCSGQGPVSSLREVLPSRLALYRQFDIHRHCNMKEPCSVFPRTMISKEVR